jgi:TetR/AcrR family transcriptional repressor of nem operon
MASRGENTKQQILDAAKGLVLERGFSATSIDEIIKSSELTKGAFFHHFPSKGELARALLQRYVDEDLSLFDRLSARADELSDDPLQRILLFLSLFEEFVENIEGPFPGCMFASYIYEGQQFSPEIHKLIETALRSWTAHYQCKLEALMAVRPPRIGVTSEQLAEMIVSLLEGAFLLARAYNDTGVITRQSRTFRQYLRSIFEE